MNVRDQLIRDEGEVLHLYYDSEGIPTIGIGCNLRDVRVPKEIARQITITPEGSRALFDLRYAAAEADVRRALPWAEAMGEVRFGVLVNMAFNMGIGGLLAFKRALAAMQIGEWDLAATEMLDSKWAEQVGGRATHLAVQMKTGEAT